MKILYGFSNCSDALYDKLVASKGLNVLRPDQKYHGLIIKGLKENGNDVECFSGLPVNRAVNKKLFLNYKSEVENGVKYKYYRSINLPILRQLSIFFGGFFSVLFSKKQKRETYLLCDVLNVANAYGMALAAKLRKIPVVFIVTDLPQFFEGKKLYKKISVRLFKKADGFVFLTPFMSDAVNKKSKPCIVVEGQSDSSIVPVGQPERTEFISGKKEIIYAGDVSSLYGLPELVEGFIKANIENAVLKIYGDGDYAPTVKTISDTNPSVKYMGVKPNAMVVEDEKRAALLVNPRPADKEYTKYSFPSKNMEYMASYTPVLTTKLEGMPSEYLSFVYLIEESGQEGVCSALKKVFDIPANDRYALGEKAGKFIKDNKNNIAQSKRIAVFLKSLN